MSSYVICSSLQKCITGDPIETWEDKYIKFINESPYEKVHLKFCKMTLGVKKQTSNIASRAELGLYPLHINIQVSMIKYWLRMIRSPKEKLIAMALDSNLQMQDQGLFTWTSMIQYILNSCNFSNIWPNCGSIRNDKKFIKLLK